MSRPRPAAAPDGYRGAASAYWPRMVRDSILPEQILHEIRHCAPERRLWAAILERALMDVGGAFMSHFEAEERSRMQRAALAWFADYESRGDGRVTLLDVCDVLEFAADRISAAVLSRSSDIAPRRGRAMKVRVDR